MPMPYGTFRDRPSTKIVSRAWMWNRTCSEPWHRMPSVDVPGAGAPAGARSGPFSIGGPSGPGETRAEPSPAETPAAMTATARAIQPRRGALGTARSVDGGRLRQGRERGRLGRRGGHLRYLRYLRDLG